MWFALNWENITNSGSWECNYVKYKKNMEYGVLSIQTGEKGE